MNHIKDVYHRGHEIVIVQDNLTELYAVDIRSDDFDGDILSGYEGLATEGDALFVARAYIDGLHDAARGDYKPAEWKPYDKEKFNEATKKLSETYSDGVEE